MPRYEMSALSQNVELKFLLGLLNSKYATILLTGIRGGDYNIGPDHIRNIPIPNASNEQQAAIIKIVDEILGQKKVDMCADTSALEQQIDVLVYRLYGLSYDEILVIDSKTTFSREEYEQA